jgi:predicted ABC-type transport system involved in lysophospholipase L1 biosynthesis ATPase subunit
MTGELCAFFVVNETVAVAAVNGLHQYVFPYVIGGIDAATSGEIVIGDHRLKEMNDKSLTRYRRDHIGYVFQQYNLIPNLTSQAIFPMRGSRISTMRILRRI